MKVVHTICRYMGYIATFFIGIMTLITVADVCGRYFFNQPLGGVTEISGLLLVIVVTLGFAWNAIEGKHVSVDILMMHTPKKFQFTMDTIFLFVIFFVIGIITWRTVIEAVEADQVSSLLRIPLTPFMWLLVIGLAMFCVATLTVAINNIVNEVKK
jgi:TRAP-type transport system small permease protein